jgi:hypothetical protein
LTRYNDAQTLVQGMPPPLSAKDLGGKNAKKGQKAMKALQRMHLGGVDVEKILTPEERGDNHLLIASLQNRLFQTDLKKDQQDSLQEFLSAKTKMSDADILTAIRLMMSTPEYQVT